MGGVGGGLQTLPPAVIWRPLARDYSYSCFNYSTNLTARMGFVKQNLH